MNSGTAQQVDGEAHAPAPAGHPAPIVVTPFPVESRALRFRRRSLTAIAVFGSGIWVGLEGVYLGPRTSTTAFIAIGLFVAPALAGFVLAVRAFCSGGAGPIPKGLAALVVLYLAVGGLVMTLLGALLAFIASAEFSRGRQLRRRGRVLLPPVVPGTDWSARGKRFPSLPPASAVAAQWRENGRTEHASVAAFARLTLDLIALGAPPSLIRAAQEDALDEIAHAERCFSLATLFDGQRLGPGPFPQALGAGGAFGNRSLRLAQLAVDSLVDGALHEGVSAAVLARLSKRCDVPVVAEAAAQLAADEGRHAAHGWDVVEWCLREGGEPVGRALQGAALALPVTMKKHRSDAAERGEWERFGIHGSALETEEYLRARSRVAARVELLTRTRAIACPRGTDCERARPASRGTEPR